MSSRHPLARDPNGSNLALWAGIILVLTLIYSLRFSPPRTDPAQRIPSALPAQQAVIAPPTAVTPPPLPADAPIPRAEERLPVVTVDEKPPVVTPPELSGTGAAGALAPLSDVSAILTDTSCYSEKTGLAMDVETGIGLYF